MPHLFGGSVPLIGRKAGALAAAAAIELTYALLDSLSAVSLGSGLSGTRGVRFLVGASPVTVHSVRLWGVAEGAGGLQLWDGANTQLANIAVTIRAGEWVEAWLPEPVEFAASTKFSVTGSAGTSVMTSYGGAKANLGLDADDPVSFDTGLYDGLTDGNTYPRNTHTNYYGIVDFGYA